MNAFMHNILPNSYLERKESSDALRVALILAAFIIISMGISIFANNPDIAVPHPDQTAAGLQDWHGNVARSGR